MTAPIAADLTAAVALIRELTPGEVVVVDEMLRDHAEGDIVAIMKLHQRGATAKRADRIEEAIQIVRAAYPDAFRLTKAQVRKLRAQLHVEHDAEPTPQEKDL